MFDGDHNKEVAKPAANPAELPDVDRLPSTKSLIPKSDAAKKTAGDVSLDNLQTSNLYELSHSPTQPHQHDKAEDGKRKSVSIPEVRHASATTEISTEIPVARSGKSVVKPAEVHEGKAFHQTEHTMREGETVEAISRHLLGPTSSQHDVVKYTIAVNQLNGIDDPRYLRSGDKLTMPGRDGKGGLTFKNPNNPDEHCTINSDGTYEVLNARTKTHSLQTSLDDFGSFKTVHKGPVPTDNYDETFIYKDHYTLTTRKWANDQTTATGSDGFVKVTDKAGNWVSDAPPNIDPYHATYDKASGLTTQHMSDGAVVKIFEKGQT